MVLTNDEFNKMRQQPKSQWSDVIDELRKADTPVPVKLHRGSNTAAGRASAQRSIRCIARYHGMLVQFVTVKRRGVKKMSVKRIGLVKPKTRAAGR